MLVILFLLSYCITMVILFYNISLTCFVSLKGGIISVTVCQPCCSCIDYVVYYRVCQDDEALSSCSVLSLCDPAVWCVWNM